ncbi:zinc finger protein 845 isoform X2 [Bombyx mori]|uniref:C2H2-type domain-containing protein n=2 Tax=Bombyx mori TaxID=7091 RepID=A0A8R2QZB1_BOMMO|nr:zinc finger protein 845 isoform X2 [Bombyx mori]
MEQDVDNNFKIICSTCLCGDRKLFALNNTQEVYQIFRLLMFDFAGEAMGDSVQDTEQLVCWECLAIMRKFLKFKWQVHNAQEHLKVKGLNQSQETLDHTYLPQPLSSLDVSSKCDYDKIFFDFTFGGDDTQYISITNSEDVKSEHYDMVTAVRDNINLQIEDHILEVPEFVLGGPVSDVMSHIVVGTDELTTVDEYENNIKTDGIPHLTMSPLTTTQEDTIVVQRPKIERVDITHAGYKIEYMSESQMLAYREELKDKVSYASSVYKCELCVLGFYCQQLIKDHFVSCHRAKPGTLACRICYVYVEESKLTSHVDSHYMKHVCNLCGHVEQSRGIMMIHVAGHAETRVPSNVIRIGDLGPFGSKGRKKKQEATKKAAPPAKPGDLRRLLSKTTIEGYKCLECDMFFKSTRARKTHVARYHREGLQCDHCKKTFVNKSTLVTHLKLHDGPLPRDECPICHKMVRSTQLKYHVQRHKSKSRYECEECNKVFSHLATYQAHLKYARAHATEQVLKYPCPMCNKGYPTKEAMQDHFNYQHLGKTAHKCPVCEKPIASRANVVKHVMRVHGEKKEKPRNHACGMCRKRFTDKKALTQHEVIHSRERPLTCDICQQTFKQKASLYTHKKRVHKVVPNKKVVEFIEATA